MILRDELRVFYGFLFSILANDGDSNAPLATEVEGGVVGRLPGGVCPEIELVAGASALEAMKDLLFEVHGEATGRSLGGAMQRAGTPLLRTVQVLLLKTK